MSSITLALPLVCFSLCIGVAIILISSLKSADFPQKVKRRIETSENSSQDGYSNACSSNYTMRPQQERQCESMPHLNCQFGICETKDEMGFLEFSCLCDNGALGPECEIKCCLECIHGQCKTYPDRTEYCKCKSGYYGMFCEIKREATTTPQLETTKRPSLDDTLPEKNACSSNYTMRALDKRRCNKQMICLYGRCEVEENEDFLEVSCLCDEGSYGQFCDTKCCLNCVDGICALFPNQTEYCKCKPGYTGTFCENSPGPLSDTINKSAASINTVSRDFPANHSCSTNYTLRSLEQRLCAPNNLVCLYGTCEMTIVRGVTYYNCVCDKGATGPQCEHQCCELNCVNGKCENRLNNGGLYCKCIDGYEGPSCAIPTNSTAMVKYGNFPTNHSCSVNYTLRSLEQRECVPNKLTCQYGRCEKTTVDDNLHFNCACDKGSYGPQCDQQCCELNCEQGYCVQLKDSPVYCKCYVGYNGSACENHIIHTVTADAKKDTWYLWVVGVCAGVLGLLILALVIIPYYMWHNRVTVIMKIVHYFQPYEDDDERTWDAFVSYKSTDVDQNFVLHTLFPKLEKELGFTLCLHFRDFMPGETIANNIINAINNSRRTILILTPRYIESEFTRFEYQVAQHEMLKRKHRIIPILLEDISDSISSMDPNLRQIIRSVTYIEYPGAGATEKKLNTFWKRMTLSMPKTRPTEERQKQLENQNKSSEDSVPNVISLNGDINVSGNKTEMETTSFSNGGINPTDNHEISVQIIEENTVACKNMKNENNGEFYNKTFIDD